MERRVNVVAAPTKALLDPSGGVGPERWENRRFLVFPLLFGRDTVARIHLQKDPLTNQNQSKCDAPILDSEQVPVGRGVSLSLLQGHLHHVLHM